MNYPQSAHSSSLSSFPENKNTPQSRIIGVVSVAKRLFTFMKLVIGFGLFFTSCTLMANEPLSMDQGFKFTAVVKDSQTVIAQWQMPPGYFLYRKHLKITADSPDVKLGSLIFPNGITKSEPGFGSYEVYKNTVSIPVPVLNAPGNTVKLTVHYQGCSEEGYCYPPTDKHITLDLSKADPLDRAVDHIAKTLDAAPALPDLQETPKHVSAQDQATALLSSGHFFSIVLSFLGFGVLLAFTPCILPMLPILSGIIVGQNREKLTTAKAFRLSLTYVLSMSLTYAIAGILVGHVGGSIQAVFQKPWLLITFSLFFVALAMSFFGFYELQLPQGLQNSLSKVSNRQRSGSYLGVAMMGCIATLIVSPCVTPALVGALGYIGKSGNALLGGSALFALGFGMGLPLLLIGTAGAKLLPRAGVWMDRVKSVFGVILLAMAIWIVDRVPPGPVTLLLWACLLIFSASFMGLFSLTAQNSKARFNQGLAAIFFVYGVLLLIGASMGHVNPLNPLYVAASQENLTHLAGASFKPVANETEVVKAITEAKGNNKIVMLDFYAQWCTSCKHMEHSTFSNPEVAKALGKLVTLKADVTDNDKIAKKLEKKFQVIAPPTLLFFDANGNELEQFRIVGEMGPKEFLAHLNTVMEAHS
jgi:thiol:disulfide interchange protein DsbD